jgi:hypothetical protein
VNGGRGGRDLAQQHERRDEHHHRGQPPAGRDRGLKVLLGKARTLRAISTMTAPRLWQKGEKSRPDGGAMLTGAGSVS